METKTRMQNAKRELLRSFSEPSCAVGLIVTLQKLVVYGMMSSDNQTADKSHNITEDELMAVSWLADLAKIVHELEILGTQFGESFEIGESIKFED